MRAVTNTTFALKFFIKVHKNIPGGLDASLSTYLSAKRGNFFVISLGKALPIYRKALVFSYSSGTYLGSVSFAANAYIKTTLFGSFLSDFLNFISSVLSKNFDFTRFSLLSAFRFWTLPFRPGLYGSWIPGSLTNYVSARKGYAKKTAPSINADLEYTLSDTLYGWFLPNWFPSFLSVLSLTRSPSATRESSILCIPNTGVVSNPSEGLKISDVTFPVISSDTPSTGVVLYKTMVNNYYAGSLRKFEVMTRVNKFFLSQSDPNSLDFKRSTYARSLLGVVEGLSSRKSAQSEEQVNDYSKLVSINKLYKEYQAIRSVRENFIKEENELFEENRKEFLKNFKPTPRQKSLFLQPFFYSTGETFEDRKKEHHYRVNRYYFIQPNRSGTPPPQFLKYGLYLDKKDAELTGKADRNPEQLKKLSKAVHDTIKWVEESEKDTSRVAELKRLINKKGSLNANKCIKYFLKNPRENDSR